MTENKDTEDGEIPFLDADPLSDEIVSPEVSESLDRDEKAIRNIQDQLRLRGKRSEEQIEDLSIDLYNSLCQKIRSGQATPSQIAQAAELFGESPEELQDRL